MKSVQIILLLLLFAIGAKAQTLTSVITTAPCDSNGVITSTVTGPPAVSYTYFYSYNFATYTITSTSSTNVYPYYTGQGMSITAMLTYANGNISYASFYLQSNPLFTANILNTQGSCTAVSGGVQVIPNGGTPPYTCNYTDNWSGNIFLNQPLITSIPAGDYRIKVVDANGCAYYQDSFYVYNTSYSMQIQTAATTANCTNGTASVIGAANGAAPLSYDWTNGSTASTINNLQTGNYKVKVTDANGCIDSTIVYVPQSITINANMVNTAATCIQSNGASTAFASGGTAPYSYQWSNGSTTSVIANVPASTYSVYISDANSCIGTGVANINATTPIAVTYANTPNLCALSNGSATLNITGGATPYNVVWNVFPLATGNTLSGKFGGNYPFSITDANGCLQNGIAIIQNTNPLLLSGSTTPSACTTANGTATVLPTNGLAPYNIIWNSSPAQTTATATALEIGKYVATVTDANGCVKDYKTIVNPINPIFTSVTTNKATCNLANGNAIVLASGGTPPFTYLWTNGSTTNSVTNLPYGSHGCLVTDGAMCTSYINAPIGLYNPLVVGTTVTNASCIFNSDGAISTALVGATGPVTYTWSTGATSANISGLPKAGYVVTVQDSIGCIVHKMVNLGYDATNNSCYCTIQGNVYADLNANCIKDGLDYNLASVGINCSNGSDYYTNNSGDYSFIVPSGTYTIAQLPKANYPAMSCNAAPIIFTATAATNCVITNHFADSVIPVHNMHISTWNTSPPRPGFAFSQRVLVSNLGTIVEPTAGSYTHDAQLATPTLSTTSNWNNVAPNYYAINNAYNLAPLNNDFVDFNYIVAVNMPLGTNLWFYDTCSYTAPISNWLVDNTSWDNVQTFICSVIGAYDPNFKEVLPAGKGPNGNIYRTDSVLEYMVHFQNLGTYYAQDVVVLDTLDADLDWKTFEPIFSSHKSKISIDKNGVLRYEFKNIHLPAKQDDEQGSNGMFTYRIKTKNKSTGTKFTNSAAIYFDFNEPIITNTTVNTIVLPDGIEKDKLVSNTNWNLYPNPAQNILYLQATSNTVAKETMYYIYDKSGRTVAKGSWSNINNGQINKVDISSLLTDVYFIKIVNGTETSTLKFLKD